MNYKKNIVLVSVVLFLSCQGKNISNPVDVQKEISELNTLSDRTEYLSKIAQIDQEIRDGKSSELLLKYGNNSPQLLQFYSKMDSIDRLNLKRVELFLSKFGYPNLDSIPKEANITPWLVIHHSSDFNKRKEFFPILYQAYHDGNVDTDQFELYLGRTYQMEFGKYPSGEGAYNPNEKIKKLIKELKLE